MRYRLSLVLAVAAVLFAAGAQATTIVLPTDEQLVDKSPLVIKGVVLASAAVERDGRIWTETTIEVESVLKGSASTRVLVREPGGIAGDRVTKVFGAPQYAAGERVLAFLTPAAGGAYRTVDLLVGKFTEGRTLAGQRLWLRDFRSDDVALLDGSFEHISPGSVQRDATHFERFLTAPRAMRASLASYEVENPVLDGAFAAASQLDVQPDFTLIDEPTIYRWSGFDSGQTANWYTTGAQSGYSGGGVNEVRIAMAAWTSYSSAKILYSYVGQRTGAPGGMDAVNGVNEIMFEDPNGDIAGSWNGSSGVVGLGGFNGVTTGPNWTSPFAADASHPQRSYSTWRITEGNLTVQDGVSASTGIPSSELAEILAHELGHTLGFGHSSENAGETNSTLKTALMYYRISGLGASLRADDQLAARWLYPGSGGGNPTPTPTVPNAPTNLSASVSGTQIALQWTDNSDNETGFVIYGAPGTSGGSFSRVADATANARAISLSGFAAGTYRFYVTAVNATGSSAGSNTATATVSAQISAAFSVSPALTGVAGTTVFTFTDESSGTVTSRLWQFGDGDTSSLSAPTHKYVTAGTYTVTLIVNGNGLQSQTSKNIVITLPTTPLTADFEWSPAVPVAGSDATFVDRSTGGATAWQWTFGDGSFSSLQNPVKRYANAGAYDVTLVVYRGTESRVISKSVTVSVPSPATPALAASFSFTPVAPAVGANVTFTDTTSGSPASWNWSFGDGSTSTQRNPVKMFAAAGRYPVTLVVGNGATTSSVTREVTVGGTNQFRTLVSAVAQTAGANGTNWRTELSLFNAGQASADVQLTYIPAAGGTKLTRGITLAAGRTAAYDNTLAQIFDIASGSGALEIVASSSLSPDLRVASRTFTGSSGTYGQDVPAVGGDVLSTRLYLPGVEASNSFRTNVGLVNNSVATVTATLTLLDLLGNTVGSSTVSLPPSTFQQSALTALIPAAASTPRSGMTLRVESTPYAVSAYASVVDNRTQDPVFIQGVPSTSGTSLMLPVIGRAPGANGTFWRSDVVFHNPRGESIGLTLRYIAAGADGRGAVTRNMLVAGGSTNTLQDVLSYFNLTSGSGALEITWSGGTGPVVMSRTYTSTEAGGTYGQSIAPSATYVSTSYVTGLRNDASFRSNIGLVNGSTTTNGVNLTLLGASGETVATAFLELAPKTQRQLALRDVFGSLPDGRFTLVASGGATLIAYGSVIDNASGDPVFYLGK